MKHVYFLLTLSSILFVSSSWADVSLQLPDNVKTVAVNGKNSNETETLILPNGVNQIAIRYQNEFGRNPNDSEMEYSDVFVVKFAANDEHLKMDIAEIQHKRDVEAFNNDPEIRIMNSNGTTIINQVAKLEIEGLQFWRDYEQELIIFNTTDSPAAMRINEPEASKPVPAGKKPAPKQIQNNSSVVAPSSPPMSRKKQTDTTPTKFDQQPIMAEEMLEYWYQQADEPTREQFRKRITR